MGGKPGGDRDSACRRPAGLGVEPRIADRAEPHGGGRGRVRWVVERAAGWPNGLRRVRVRYDRRAVVRNPVTTRAAAATRFRILHHDAL